MENHAPIPPFPETPSGSSLSSARSGPIYIQVHLEPGIAAERARIEVCEGEATANVELDGTTSNTCTSYPVSSSAGYAGW